MDDTQSVFQHIVKPDYTILRTTNAIKQKAVDLIGF